MYCHAYNVFYIFREFCDCAVYNDTVKSLMRPIQYSYWEAMDELINVNGTYDGDDNFTVVLQPHMRDMIPPKTVSFIQRIFYAMNNLDLKWIHI